MVGQNKSKGSRAGFTEILKEGLSGPKRSLGRIEAEGERLFKGIVEFAERYVPEAQKKAVEELTQEARKLLAEVNENLEERTKKAVERLNLPSRKDLEEYNKKVRSVIEETVGSRLEKLRVPDGKQFEAMGKQLRSNLDAQVNKGLGRLNIARAKDVESIDREVKKLRKDVNALLKAEAPAKKGTSRKASAE